MDRLPPSLVCRRVQLLAASMTFAALCGCAGFTAAPIADPIAGVQFSGNVHGGQQPVSSSHVYLYATGANGYGSASTSLLGTGATLVGLTSDGTNYYTTTDANGNFIITSNYVCPSAASQVYALAVGGNPGLATGTNNTAITLLAPIGNCSSLSATSNIVINEASTAAAVTGLQQFMVDTAHIGTSANNLTGIQNAFLAISNLYTVGAGAVRTTPISGSGSSPQAKLNTLANILSPCVNSVGPASTACASLFSAATPGGGTKPTDVAGTMLSIAKNPGNNTTGLYQQINASAPFGPGLSAAPNDYTLAVTFTGGGLMLPGLVIIDSAGNAWTSNCPTCAGLAGTDSIVAFSPLGAPLTGSSGFTSSIHKPQGIAFDTSGNLWSVDDATSTLPDQVVKMNSSTGTVTAPFPFSNSGIDSPSGIALDASGNAWIANSANSVISEISGAGSQVAAYSNNSVVSPNGIGIDGTGVVFASGTASSNIYKPVSNTVYSSAGLAQPLGIAIDHSDNVWTLNNQANTLSVLNGSTGAAVTTNVGIGFVQSAVIAIDGAGTGWSANCRQTCGNANFPDNLLHYNISGQSLTTSDGFQDPHLSTAGTAAIDASGNVWVSNNSGGSLTEFLGVAQPVKTPLAAAVAANQLGTRP